MLEWSDSELEGSALIVNECANVFARSTDGYSTVACGVSKPVQGFPKFFALPGPLLPIRAADSPQRL